MSKSTKSKSSRQVTRAELKAYQTRRAEENHRIAAPHMQTPVVSSAIARNVYSLSRDEEYAVIRSDLRRLLMILGVLMVVMAIATLLFR